jgi:hypothetical protein
MPCSFTCTPGSEERTVATFRRYADYYRFSHPGQGNELPQTRRHTVSGTMTKTVYGGVTPIVTCCGECLVRPRGEL